MKKRTIISALFVLIISVLLSACGGSSSTKSQNNENGTKTTQNGQRQKAAASEFPLTITDQAGHKVTINKQPKHIASVTEGTDEILTGLVPKNKLALVTSQSADPTYSNVTDLVKGIPQIPSANAEKIIAAKPDLVLLASYTKQGIVDQIEQANIPVYEFSDFNSINEIEKNIKVVGQLVGEKQKASAMVQTMQNKIKAISKAVQGQKKLSVLNYSSYGYAAGKNTTVDEMIEKAGGVNAAKGLNGWQKISDEEIEKLNPDVILTADSDKGFDKKVLSDAALQDVNAVKDKRVVVVNDADLSSVSQYIVKGISDIAHDLYPDVTLP